MNNVKFPFSAKESNLQAAEECKLACFKDCACTAYAYNENAVCSLWHGELLNLIQLSTEDPGGQTIYLKLAASEFQNPGGEKKLMWVIAIAVVVAVLLPASYIVYQWRRRLKEKEEMERSQNMLLFDINMSMETRTSELSEEERAKGKSKDSWLPLFSLSSAWELWNTDRAMDLKDPILEYEASYPMLIRYINVALLCVQEIAADRPTMSEVVSMLTNEHFILPSPKQPAFSYLKSLQNSVPPMSMPGACSMNNVTLSLIEPR
ncbi:hypothetical protein Dsin_022734 [Dipteronia sinensis]|uniref:Apple domain-containing protein n=1 Tax=Dipteronia sinensis TaxID=43782 RepID=A0AAE0A322_9ROSI|nr:hypothetical protein Dsin_022734 [Dipteronia sinensis]